MTFVLGLAPLKPWLIISVKLGTQFMEYSKGPKPFHFSWSNDVSQEAEKLPVILFHPVSTYSRFNFLIIPNRFINCRRLQSCTHWLLFSDSRSAQTGIRSIIFRLLNVDDIMDLIVEPNKFFNPYENIEFFGKCYIY